jgi:hypothetical protein
VFQSHLRDDYVIPDVCLEQQQHDTLIQDSPVQSAADEVESDMLMDETRNQNEEISSDNPNDSDYSEV